MNVKIKRAQKAFLKAMKKKFSEDALPKKDEISNDHPTIIVGGLRRFE